MRKFKNIVWIGVKQVEELMCDIKQTTKVRIMGVLIGEQERQYNMNLIMLSWL
jgi:hypothetical protein